MIACQYTIYIKIAGLAHLLKLNKDLLTLTIFWHLKPLTVKCHCSLLTASRILNAVTKKITIIEGMRQSYLLPILIPIFLLIRCFIEEMTLCITPLIQRVFQWEGICKQKLPSIVEINSFSDTHVFSFTLYGIHFHQAPPKAFLTLPLFLANPREYSEVP